jgi:oligopeptide transport system ATP-binding protein
MVMYAGKPVEYGSADELIYQPLHPYPWGLVDSLPRHDISKKGTLHPIEGQPPSLIDVPSGCAFHPRCPYATELCKSEIPPLRDMGGGHLAACHSVGDANFVRRTLRSDGEVA